MICYSNYLKYEEIPIRDVDYLFWDIKEYLQVIFDNPSYFNKIALDKFIDIFKFNLSLLPLTGKASRSMSRREEMLTMLDSNALTKGLYSF